MRYLPPSGTAGLARSLVSGNNRVPAPPPITIDRVRWVVPGGNAGVEGACPGNALVGCMPYCVCTRSITSASGWAATYLRAYATGLLPLSVLISHALLIMC